MLVIHQDGMLFVQQKPHSHSYHDLTPSPVPGEVPSKLVEAKDGRFASTLSI